MKYNEKWVWGTSRFYPHEMTEMIRNVLILLMVLSFLTIYWPGLLIPREEPADPMNTPEHIKPEWYFVFMFQTLKFIPAKILFFDGEMLGILAFGVIGVLLILVPFFDRKAVLGETSKIFTALGIVSLVYVFVMTIISYAVPQTF